MARPHLAVLLVCLLRAFSAARAAPLSRESVIMRAKVKLNAEQLVIRLNIYLTVKKVLLMQLLIDTFSFFTAHTTTTFLPPNEDHPQTHSHA